MRKFGKKFWGVLAAATMTAVMGMSSLAAPSAEVDGIVTEIVEAVDKDGNELELELVAVTDEYADVAEAIKDEDALKEVLGDAYEEGMAVIDVRELFMRSGRSLNGATLTFKVPGVTADTNVAVLCYAESTGEWIVLDAEAGAGVVTAGPVDELGILAFVVEEGTLAPSSPTTGESNMSTVVLMAVVVAATGAFVLRKRVVA